MRLRAASLPSLYESSTYGPEPVILPSPRTLSAGYSLGATSEAAGEPRTYGKVASEVFRWKTTVSGSGVSIFSRLPKRSFGPTLELMVMIRSRECLTALESSGSPLENFRPLRRVHRYAWLAESVNSQLWAASGWGLVEPVGKASRVW